MIKFKIDQAKSLFFNEAVLKSLDKAAAKRLPKAGAFIMTDARRSMRPAKQMPKASMTAKERASFDRRMKLFKAGKIASKPKRPLIASKPGEPPRVRSGLLRKHLYFAYDSETKSVVVGPALLNRTTGAPATLESGGSTSISSLRFVTNNGDVKTERKTRTVKVEARPYMQPAYKRQSKAIQQLFRDAVKG